MNLYFFNPKFQLQKISTSKIFFLKFSTWNPFSTWKSQLSFGIVHDSEKDVLFKLKVKHSPSLILISKYNSEPVFFEGRLQELREVLNFLSDELDTIEELRKKDTSGDLLQLEAKSKVNFKLKVENSELKIWSWNFELKNAKVLLEGEMRILN